MEGVRVTITGLRYGDRVQIVHRDLDFVATGKYIGYAGGHTAMVDLDGTRALVQIPRDWIEREESNESAT